MNRSELLDKAKEIVNGARQENYGRPEKNFANIATYWSVYLGRDIKAVDVAAMMILMKLARLENNPKHEDSWVDIAGYASNGCEIATEVTPSVAILFTKMQEDINKIDNWSKKNG